MFDVSFSELMLIGVIALIVIGPERLPKVARTIGHLVGRAQRYVSDVKSDIQREVNLDELNTLKNQMDDAAKSVKSSMNEATDDLRKPLDEAQQALTDASASVESLVETARSETAETKPPAPATSPAAPVSPAISPATATSPASDTSAAVADTTTKTETPT